MFDDLFTSYSSLDPPPKPRKASILNNTANNQINPELYKSNMIIEAEEPNVNWNLDLEEIYNPFEFRTEAPRFERPLKTTPDTALDIVNLARSFVGGQYTWGGKTPNSGFDCSGLISYAYKLYGVDLPATTFGIFKAGLEVSLSSAKVGDIICTPGSGRSGKHVKMISKIDPDGQIYTIEAKGKNYGIIESPLKRTDNIVTIRRIIGNLQKTSEHTVPSLTSVNGKFSSKSNFTQSLISSYRKALINNNMDPEWAPMLVASASIESSWGANPSGSFNYGGVKVSDSQIKNGVSYTMRSTVDYVPGKGNIRRNQPFRNFESVDDYCNYMVKWLKSSGRYGDAFNKYSASQPMQAWEHILRAGYGGGSDSNIRKYMGWMNSRYNQVKQA